MVKDLVADLEKIDRTSEFLEKEEYDSSPSSLNAINFALGTGNRTGGGAMGGIGSSFQNQYQSAIAGLQNMQNYRNMFGF